MRIASSPPLPSPIYVKMNLVLPLLPDVTVTGSWLADASLGGSLAAEGLVGKGVLGPS